MIHEGTNGIQALDLLGRKMTMKGSQGLVLLEQAIQADIACASNPQRAAQMQEALDRLVKTTHVLLEKKADSQAMLSNAHDYLNMAGHTVVAWQWLRMETAAQQELDQNGDLSKDQADFLQGKLATSKYFFNHELPKTQAQAELLVSFEPSTLEMKDEFF